MIEDARRVLGDGQALQADICVVGGGVAGLTMADRLRGTGQSVCVLESGGLEHTSAIQSLYQGNMTGISTWTLDGSRLRQFGGTSGHWNGWCFPLEREDFQAREWIPHSGWPIGFDDLEPYYPRAQARLSLGGFDYDAQRLAPRAGRPVIETPAGRLATGIIQFSDPPTRFGETYREPLDAAGNIRVILHANATNIVLGSGHDRVSRIECKTLEGVSFAVEASRYVLALGGIENARLLLASDEQRPEGVANSSGTVGRFFMEHPTFNLSAAWRVSREADLGFYLDHTVNIPVDGTPKQVPVLGYLSLSAETRAREGLPDLGVAVTERSLEGADTGKLDPGVVGALLRQGAGGDRLVRLTPRIEQTPTAESNVTLGSGRDALGMRRVKLNWAIRRADRRKLLRALEIIGSELASAGLGRVWIPHEGERFSWQVHASPGHHMGTTRMGSDRRDAVVDSNCRTFDVSNLYVAGSSVFRTSGKANPTLTIVALAERLADHLMEGS